MSAFILLFTPAVVAFYRCYGSHTVADLDLFIVTNGREDPFNLSLEQIYLMVWGDCFLMAIFLFHFLHGVGNIMVIEITATHLSVIISGMVIFWDRFFLRLCRKGP